MSTGHCHLDIYQAIEIHHAHGGTSHSSSKPSSPIDFAIPGNGKYTHPVAQTKKYWSYFEPFLSVLPQTSNLSASHRSSTSKISRIKSLLTISSATTLVYLASFF